MNVLYLHCHDLGRFVQPYGHAIPAPTIQRLAEEGVLFRQAFSVAPTCSPSRAGLVTGQWPHCCGMLGLATASHGFTLNDYGQHLAAVLQAAGHETAVAGVQHVARRPWQDPREIGYDRLLNHDENDMALHADTLEAVRGFLSEPRDRPFFLSVGFAEPHRYNPGDGRTFSWRLPEQPADIDDRYCAPLPLYPDTPLTRREAANFKRGVGLLDEGMGAVLDALDGAGLSDDTLVICTTDHGPGFPAMKCTLRDQGIGVMLIMRGPCGFRGGRVVDAMVSQIDIYPTVCELLGVPPPGWLQGQSLMPLVRGEQDEINEMIFAEQNYHQACMPLRAVRTRRYKYVRHFGPPVAMSQMAADAGPTQAFWKDHGWDEQTYPGEQLFDLVFDPNEACNLAGDAGCSSVLADMRGRLERWMKETDDPILEGCLPEPPAWLDPGWRERLNA